MKRPMFTENPFTEVELRWLWGRYQCCTFPVASFPKRFARNAFEQLTDNGKVMAASLAFQYRRQIFKDSAKWDMERFTRAVQQSMTACAPVFAPLCQSTPANS